MCFMLSLILPWLSLWSFSEVKTQLISLANNGRWHAYRTQGHSTAAFRPCGGGQRSSHWLLHLLLSHFRFRVESQPPRLSGPAAPLRLSTNELGASLRQPQALVLRSRRPRLYQDPASPSIPCRARSLFLSLTPPSSISHHRRNSHPAHRRRHRSWVFFLFPHLFKSQVHRLCHPHNCPQS